MDIDPELKRELLENNINRIIKLTAVMLNSLSTFSDTEIKIAYARIHDDAMAAKRLIERG